jgi:hypothetical protein
MKSNEIILHGEATVFPSIIPTAAKKKRIKRDSFVVVANSETTGNHHVVDALEGVDFYETEAGTLFMENSVETKIRCVHENRHDAITIPPGTYEFGTQQEYDPFAARMQKVRD